MEKLPHTLQVGYTVRLNSDYSGLTMTVTRLNACAGDYDDESDPNFVEVAFIYEGEMTLANLPFQAVTLVTKYEPPKET